MKIWMFNDSDYVAAETLEEAKNFYEKLLSDDDVFSEPYELTKEDMNTHIYTDVHNDTSYFQEELDRRIAANEYFPQIFASTEY
jgi:hypothetical protein